MQTAAIFFRQVAQRIKESGIRCIAREIWRSSLDRRKQQRKQERPWRLLVNVVHHDCYLETSVQPLVIIQLVQQLALGTSVQLPTSSKSIRFHKDWDMKPLD
ncbi:hypothetical protein K7X08_011544 [Anisodus acutangulus]|uniref:Uncharacterized protein n=1 Tax=Anisodus acutangulus TaxID=402998 RepID=A0A9Q1MN91_9SOLA|nr:hypothetical protein K7X08_011544 [Anisodus acutangulus]